jgi:hypothetical protein
MGRRNNVLCGYQLKGLSHDSAHGGDCQPGYGLPGGSPQERTSDNVYCAFTHDDSTHSIVPMTTGPTKFDLPTMSSGNYDLVSVANSIPSNSIRVSVH